VLPCYRCLPCPLLTYFTYAVAGRLIWFCARCRPDASGLGSPKKNKIPRELTAPTSLSVCLSLPAAVAASLGRPVLSLSPSRPLAPALLPLPYRPLALPTSPPTAYRPTALPPTTYHLLPTYRLPVLRPTALSLSLSPSLSLSFPPLLPQPPSRNASLSSPRPILRVAVLPNIAPYSPSYPAVPLLPLASPRILVA
jgi:hypothetical protein